MGARWAVRSDRGRGLESYVLSVRRQGSHRGRVELHIVGHEGDDYRCGDEEPGVDQPKHHRHREIIGAQAMGKVVAGQLVQPGRLRHHRIILVARLYLCWMCASRKRANQDIDEIELTERHGEAQKGINEDQGQEQYFDFEQMLGYLARHGQAFDHIQNIRRITFNRPKNSEQRAQDQHRGGRKESRALHQAIDQSRVRDAVFAHERFTHPGSPVMRDRTHQAGVAKRVLSGPSAIGRPSHQPKCHRQPICES
jgi:hypothetical protein